MEEMCRGRFQDNNAQGADHALGRLITDLPLAIQPGIGGGEDLLPGLFDRPGIRCAEIIAEKTGDTALAGLFASIAAAHAIGNGGNDAFVGQLWSVRDDSTDKVFVVVFYAFIGSKANCCFE